MEHHDISYQYRWKDLSVDLELTNKCNLHCTFCPREKTPAKGRMTRENFNRVLERIEESPLPLGIAACGSGDPLLHPELGDFVEQAAKRDIPFRITTAGTLLSPQKSAELLQAGLSEIHFSITGIGDHYSKTYGFPFEKTLANVVDFQEQAAIYGNCKIGILIIQTREVAKEIETILKFWESAGLQRNAILLTEEHNRAGSYTGKTSSFTSTSANNLVGDSPRQNEKLTCPAPFLSTFIGWNGHYYLCMNDWEKRVDIGDISTTSIHQAMMRKKNYLADNGKLCQACSFKPENYLRDSGKNPDSPPRQSPTTYLANAVKHNQLAKKILEAC